MADASPNCPNRSSRFASRTSMPYFVMSKLVHSPPNFVGYLLVSQRVIVLMPLCPAQTPSHISSTHPRRNVTPPSPVITPRRLVIGRSCQLRVARCELRQGRLCPHLEIRNSQ